jgi:hypothetical protein
MFELLKNQNTVIFIIIVILLGILFFMSNKTENYTSSCSRESMDNTQQIQQVVQQIKETQPAIQPPTQATTNNKIEFRVYYANWCGWSKKALALLNSDEFKTEMNKIQDKATLVLLDCEGDGKQQCDAEKIQGFPTMKLSKNGELIEFNGPRTTEGIISFIKEHF